MSPKPGFFFKESASFYLDILDAVDQTNNATIRLFLQIKKNVFPAGKLDIPWHKHFNQPLRKAIDFSFKYITRTNHTTTEKQSKTKCPFKRKYFLFFKQCIPQKMSPTTIFLNT